ncbi:MAG: hypothetical protein QHC67_15230 [Sphingobium sp.]|uniref:hypothetical protein n=1 Tax=Sphingobium sp. TaxID=1912891 RepID=UPI0029B779F7|nr:hypothetical protein [Sphingobium sp.]MDX3911151.1 hypothetical protein [Sphingobium sp.]
MSRAFNPASPQCWIARGRDPEHAAIIASAWQSFPDLPADAPLELRMRRTRERVTAMRPVMDAMHADQERARQARNFAFTQERVADGRGDARETAILRGRDLHRYDWDRCVQYASGWYAANAGWAMHPPYGGNTGLADRHLVEAYLAEFRDAGGDPADLFDTARREYIAAERSSTPTRSPSSPISGRPLPSSWPKPSDAPRPTPWRLRLLVLGAPEAGMPVAYDDGAGAAAGLLTLMEKRTGADEATIIVVTATGFMSLSQMNAVAWPPSQLEAAATLAKEGAHAERLASLISGGDFDEILVAAQGAYLSMIDAHAAALPMCQIMERTRNTVRQQREHFRIWLDRGLGPGEMTGAGHIRWGKAANGLSAKLGEFTARYYGKVPGAGHRIIVELAGGAAAQGYVTNAGEPVLAESYVSNQRQLRAAMTARLRAFGAATCLSQLHHTPNVASPHRR